MEWVSSHEALPLLWSVTMPHTLAVIIILNSLLLDFLIWMSSSFTSFLFTTPWTCEILPAFSNLKYSLDRYSALKEVDHNIPVWDRGLSIVTSFQRVWYGRGEMECLQWRNLTHTLSQPGD